MAGVQGESPAGQVPAVPSETQPHDPPGGEQSGRAFITVTDAAGRVLFRRAATQSEIEDALHSAARAEREGHATMDRIAADRFSAELGDLKGEMGP